MLSFWESESLLQFYYIIAGSGITGLSTAIELKEKFPKRSVLILERGIIPAGASTRNAGFACMGSVTELLDDLEHMPVEKMIELFEWRRAGLLKLRRRLGDSNIAYAENGSFELIQDDQVAALEKINYLNSLLTKHSKTPVFSLANDKIEAFGFSTKYVRALIETKGEGELHSGKMMAALIKLALSKGVEIKTGSNIEAYSQLKDKVEVCVGDPVSKGKIIFQANNFILCTNAFTPDLLPGEAIKPGRGQVLVTAPIKGLKWKGIFHFDKGYYYFREINGRILLGGGRNLDFKKETSTELALNNEIQFDLENKLKNLILPDTPFVVEKRWAGIMAFGPDKFPVVRQISENVFGAFRLGGMGIALGSKVAESLVDLMAQSE